MEKTNPIEGSWVGSLLSEEAWLIRERGWRPESIPFYETVFTLANGYMGTRGSLEQGGQTGRPGTYFAGVFDATPNFFSELVNGPNWVGIKVVADGETMDMEKGEVLEYGRALDLKQGVLAQVLRWKDPQGRVTRFETVRLVHIRQKNIGLIRGVMVPENYSGTLSLEAGIDGSSFNTNIVAQVKVKHLRLVERKDRGEEGIYLGMKTVVSDISIGMASKLRLDGTIRRSVQYDVDRMNEVLTFTGRQGKSYAFEKFVAFYTSRDVENVKGAVLGTLDAASRTGGDRLSAEHRAAWASRWADADIQILGDDIAQQSFRFNLYHLMQLANREDDRISIGAKGLHGEGYRGHVFWDTEIFMLPFYIYTDPEAARSLLMYRAHTLDAARKNARSNGYRGAQFAWESADSGEEFTPKELGDPFTGKAVRIWTGEEEHHIVADVAFGVDHYVTSTGDEEFLLDYGAEIVLETARFWASRAILNDQKGRYEIRKVIGPDEFHEHVDNSVYTNAMARWNLRKALKYAGKIRAGHSDVWETLKEKIGLEEAELEEWREVADRLYIPRDVERGLDEEFEGYFGLEDRKVTEFDEHGMPVLSEEVEDRVGETQLIKQADVVMLHYLLGEEFDPEARRINFGYYEPRTTHRSSLSPSIYAIMGMEVGHYERAYTHFLHSARVDLDDNQGNTDQGIHAASMGGTWQAAVNGFAGMRIREGKLSFDPWLPEGWERMAFRINWQGDTLEIVITSDGAGFQVDTRRKKDRMKKAQMSKPK
jgi:kojibiose phosphorylase